MNVSFFKENYSWKSCLLWGSFYEHCCKAVKSKDHSGRFTHIIAATIEFIPIVSQITSTVEALIANIIKENKKKNAAVIIQRSVRRYLSFKKSHLSNRLVEKTKKIIEDKQLLSQQPQMRNFSALRTIYFPKDLPVVIKEEFCPKRRCDKMNKARDICKQNKYTHITVPGARAYKGFLIEEKMNEVSRNFKTNIGYYLENLESFNAVAAEFTEFLFEGNLRDITGNISGESPLVKACRVPIARYDNVLFTGPGKIALVDLEDFSLRSDKQFHLSACLDAIRFFPHHLDVIMSVVKKHLKDRFLDDDYEYEAYMSNVEDILKKEQIQVLDYYDKVYNNHLNLVIFKGIHWDNPTCFEIDREVNEKIIKNINLKLYEQNEEKFAPFSPLFLEDVVASIKEVLESRLKRKLHNYSELLEVRTFASENVYEKAKSKFMNRPEIKKKFSELQQSNDFSLNNWLDEVNFYIFEQLVRYNQLSAYVESGWFGC